MAIYGDGKHNTDMEKDTSNTPVWPKSDMEIVNDRIAKLEKIVEKLDEQIEQIVHIQQRMMEWVKNK